MRQKSKKYFILSVIIVAVLIIIFVLCLMIYNKINTNTSKQPTIEEINNMVIKQGFEENGTKVYSFKMIKDDVAYLQISPNGDRERQIVSSMASIFLFYPYTSKYVIQIINYSEEICNYEIKGDTFRNWINTLKNNSEVTPEFIKMQREINESEMCTYKKNEPPRAKARGINK